MSSSLGWGKGSGEEFTEVQISVGFLDPDQFTSTNISYHSRLVTKAISNAMNNDYVVSAYCTSHWVTVIICMKFKEVWYLDSAKQHPPLKFSILKPVVNWSVSCRFCSQKFNLLVFLIGIADHAWAIGDHAPDGVTKGKKKVKSHTKAQNKSHCKTEIFYGPFLPIWYCINLSFWYLDAVCSAAMGSSLCGFHVAFQM
jgi:hypothetical protein